MFRPHYLLALASFLTALLVVAHLAGLFSSDAVTSEEPVMITSDLWRRTKDGWEIAWWLTGPRQFYFPSLHPGWLVLLQLAGLFTAYLMDEKSGFRQPRKKRGDHPVVLHEEITIRPAESLSPNLQDREVAFCEISAYSGNHPSMRHLK